MYKQKLTFFFNMQDQSAQDLYTTKDRKEMNFRYEKSTYLNDALKNRENRIILSQG
ncbi:hypothetical protein QJS04_geneDACA017089 [Acorus gramineus]|uniref:Uncharacterized protein n=1 Tax=Acorus gramineus TaxID=55184 RepID=A0AAV9AW91_ACOGR|nr:hypothetical protein QJS04_geneDACA017089 [Acorus gramineus]